MEVRFFDAMLRLKLNALVESIFEIVSGFYLVSQLICRRLKPNKQSLAAKAENK